MGNEDELKKLHQHDRINLLYSNSYAGMFISMIASGALAFGFLQPANRTEKIYWWLLMNALLLLRLTDAIVWARKVRQGLRGKKTDLLRFSAGAISTAVLWCFYCLYFYAGFDLSELTTSIIIVSAMAGGAVNILSGDKTTSVTYSMLLLLPFSALLLSSSEYYHNLLGGLGVFFSLVMVVSAIKSADFTLKSIELRHQNNLLLENMEEQVVARTRQIYDLSNLDALTRLFNRTAFLSHVREIKQSSIRQNKGFSILFIDLDGFKRVNDNIGHSVGDEVLLLTAQRIKACCSEAMTLCRWGGDEFLVCVPSNNTELLVKLCGHLVEHISDAMDIKGHRIKISATIGIALYPDHSKDEQELIQLADMAMYNQKSSLSQRWSFFDDQLASQMKRENFLRSRLDTALENEEFRLVFHPIVRASDSTVVAFEALLRWQLDGENVTPDEFISLAEQTGHIRQIGYWVLHKSCLESKKLAELYGAISVCVNVSVVQFQDPGFAITVEDMIRHYAVDARFLHIEITESVFSGDKDNLFFTIKHLQSLGIKVSIDDFGTGYSSLSAMQDLNVNIVKIDKSFIDKLDVNGMAIVTAVMSISANMGYKVVAEGVETAEQAEKLTKAGVHFLQGYLYERPLEMHQVNSFIQKNRSSTTYSAPT
ncbi:bifunctional diguanylate cyclase/phosphodiesterase [Rheinheimera sp.]|uniref:putative bifunctional diguanylate cyclase/phosphodiesterase n=1 Tax=Rheinheimera sp. TaxID=1869214 RepID=UPI0026112D6E|nr:bifunctional diguanylate cyclase/phosphodiesterase [Rheinheimera sp.]MCA1930439.1 bifunctional diguanylate cyclase/phosphodiesterase [Rheinheimera sp.]